MLIYTIYKVTNLINQKYYIGAHSTHNIDDNYLGSGKAIQTAIKKYGKHNFIKQIMFICSSEEEMFIKEKQVVNEQVVNDPLSYNMTLGGNGGWSHVDSSGLNNPMHRDEVKKKVKESWKANPVNKIKILNNLKKATEKAQKLNLGKKRPNHSKWMKNNFHRIYNKEKSRKSLNKNMYLLINPNGLEYLTDRLTDFIKSNNLSGAIYDSIKNNGRILKRGKCRGWSCKIYQP